jgi:Zinc carboxypeptidase
MRRFFIIAFWSNKIKKRNYICNMNKILTFLLFFSSLNLFAQHTVFEKSNGTASATYFEIIDFYKKMDAQSDMIAVETVGESDAGYPLHIVKISSDKNFDPKKWQSQNKVVILINNGIHPGEPDGIDASMLLVRDIKDKKIILPSNVVLAIIPVYNIGGCLNRNTSNRVNQDGPIAYGFRGNAQNLDLNRDFTKNDSKESKTFAKIFHTLKPAIFLDNHVSDGADFQHTMTLITTQYDKLGTPLDDVIRKFEKDLYSGMKTKNWDMIPYVEFDNANLQKGITMFYEPPRYSSGYAALFGTLSFISETHMLKPFKQRVTATYDLMKIFIEKASIHATSILKARKNAAIQKINQTTFPLKWTADEKIENSKITFSGYEQDSTLSEATGLQKMYYNHNKPYNKDIIFYNKYNATNFILKPKAYIIPAGWADVIERLQLNEVKLNKLQKDTTIFVDFYKIESYKSRTNPYEKHHGNYAVKVAEKKDSIRFLKGDYIIYTNQESNRYIVEMLEPTGDDSFFAWNFFDAVLQQKEGYSDYRWEDVAAKYLKTNPTLKEKLEAKKIAEPAFAKDSKAILDFIYKNSPYYEPVHMRYPVFKIKE